MRSDYRNNPIFDDMRDEQPEDEIPGYRWFTNVDPYVSFGSRTFSRDRKKPYTDDEIKEHFAREWELPADETIVRDAKLFLGGKALYVKELR